MRVEILITISNKAAEAIYVSQMNEDTNNLKTEHLRIFPNYMTICKDAQILVFIIQPVPHYYTSDQRYHANAKLTAQKVCNQFMTDKELC